jgi:hypothetical protein
MGELIQYETIKNSGWCMTLSTRGNPVKTRWLFSFIFQNDVIFAFFYQTKIFGWLGLTWANSLDPWPSTSLRSTSGSSLKTLEKPQRLAPNKSSVKWWNKKINY